ncbi:MAG: methyltransferase [Parvibaculaceae bacterium]
MQPQDREAFIRANTKVLPVPLVPEISLHLAEESLPIWRKTEEELGEIGLPPPFWAFAWAGGQALARHVLDNADLVRGRDVLDLAAGSGLVSVAALKAGAARVLAADIDPMAGAAVRINAPLNGVEAEVTTLDLLGAPPGSFDTILVGDIFYEKALATRALAWLRQAQRQGSCVLIGDPGRSYLPRGDLHKLAEYCVPVTRELEDAEIKRTGVWALQAGMLTKP